MSGEPFSKSRQSGRLDARLKTRLQSLGVELGRPQEPEENASEEGCRPRRGGAGPAEGMTFICEGRAVNVPSAPAESGSPYVWRPSAGGGVLRGEGAELPADTVSREAFYRRRTSDGTPFGQVALLHGTDCLASTVIQSCEYWGGPKGCAFCGIETSLREGRTHRIKTPEQLAEVARASMELGVRHVTLTSGSTREGSAEIRHLAACTRAIREATGLPVQVQALAPSPDGLRRLHEAGASCIGLHAESLDFHALSKVAPVKAWLGWQGFLELWREAVKIFGRWQVVTYVIIGLGEDKATTLSRLAEIIEEGVYPHVVPFRAVPGAKLAHRRPPDPELMEEYYRHVARLLRAAGGSWSAIEAGCGRCTACSALPDFENELRRGGATTGEQAVS